MPKLALKDVLADTTSKIRSKDLIQRLGTETQNVMDAEQRLIQAGHAGQMDRLDAQDFKPSFLTVPEMQKMYDQRLQPSTSPGRPHYDELVSSAPHNRCPYCGERRVKTIDHYLPKVSFSLLAITPPNMVPSCSDCNHAKLDYKPSLTEPAVLHPYFDSVENIRWLHAVITPSQPPTVHFEVCARDVGETRTIARIRQHFHRFELAVLFGAHAGQTIDELDGRIPGIFAKGGENAVKEYLLEEANFRSVGRHNTWQRALFEGLAGSQWYCAEYFAS